MSVNTNIVKEYSQLVEDLGNSLRSFDTERSSWPRKMMPFFSLFLLETKALHEYDRVVRSKIAEGKSPTDAEKFALHAVRTKDYYNPVLLVEGLTLKKIISAGDRFNELLDRYLDGYKEDVKALLGIIQGSESNNLNLAQHISDLRSSGTNDLLKHHLSLWAQIDFNAYSMAEIVDLEQHIKGRWADWSGAAAGEQYTPADMVDFCGALISNLMHRVYPSSKPYCAVYDPTCGGAGALTRISELLRISLDKPVRIFGQEIKGSLAALGQIDGMARDGDMHIKKGDTLLEDKFAGLNFNVVFSNPPYALDWKTAKAQIEQASSDGRLGKAGYPSTGDAQLLFLEHIAFKLQMFDPTDNSRGLAVVILNGSPMFNGDAGSGESAIRKYLLDNDLVEAIIQLPAGEFYNTGIGTYAWILNTEKAPARKDKIFIADASKMAKPATNKVGKKTTEMDPSLYNPLIEQLVTFEDGPSAKIVSKYAFMYNKYTFKRLVSTQEAPAVTPFKLQASDIRSIQTADLTVINTASVKIEDVELIKEKISEGIISVEFVDVPNGSSGRVVVLDDESIGIDFVSELTQEPKLQVYSGRIVGKVSVNKSKSVVISVSIEQQFVSEEERIEYHPDPEQNRRNIEEFLIEWSVDDLAHVTQPKNLIGAEFNISRHVGAVQAHRSSVDIMNEILAIDSKLCE